MDDRSCWDEIGLLLDEDMPKYRGRFYLLVKDLTTMKIIRPLKIIKR
jgi:hypothetical protein